MKGCNILHSLWCVMCSVETVAFHKNQFPVKTLNGLLDSDSDYWLWILHSDGFHVVQSGRWEILRHWEMPKRLHTTPCCSAASMPGPWPLVPNCLSASVVSTWVLSTQVFVPAEACTRYWDGAAVSVSPPVLGATHGWQLAVNHCRAQLGLQRHFIWTRIW